MWVAKIVAYSYTQQLKFFRFSILNDRTVLHYKGLVVTEKELRPWSELGGRK